MKNSTAVICLSLAGLFFSPLSISATEISLRADVSSPYCTFDRVKTQSSVTVGKYLSGNFSVNCQDEALPYRLITSLSPWAMIGNDDNRYQLKWHIRQGFSACDEQGVSNLATPFHSGSRDKLLTGSTGITHWHYCVSAVTKEGDLLDVGDWGVQGNFELSLVDALNGNVLPSGATLLSINFDNDSAVINDEQKQDVITYLMNSGGNENMYVQIHSHTSLVGDHDYNHGLSLMRLANVRKWLVDELGFVKSNTWGQAWGETRPKAINVINDEAAINRRVELVFIRDEQRNFGDVKLNVAPKIMSF